MSNSYFEDQIHTVQETLDDLGAGELPILMVFNKIDRLQDRSIISTLAERYPNHVFISALRGINILGFQEEVIRLLEKEFVVEQIVVPQADQRLISKLYDIGEVLERTYEDAKVLMKIRLHRRDRERLLQIVK